MTDHQLFNLLGLLFSSALVGGFHALIYRDIQKATEVPDYIRTPFRFLSVACIVAALLVFGGTVYSFAPVVFQ